VAFTHTLLPFELSRTLRTRAERLLDQQVWLWNHDVHHPSGNLLLAYAFQCDCGPTSGGPLTASAYTLGLPGERQMRVCESGLFITTGPTGDGVYVRRLGFTPQHVDGVRVEPNSCAPLRATKARAVSTSEWKDACAALAEALSAIAQYEEWVLVHFGIAYRREAITTRGAGLCAWRNATPIQETAGAWRELADWYREVAERSFPAVAANRRSIPVKSSDKRPH
jgi:hypothetical protein